MLFSKLIPAALTNVGDNTGTWTTAPTKERYTGRRHSQKGALRTGAGVSVSEGVPDAGSPAVLRRRAFVLEENYRARPPNCQ
jgi:NAD-dependent SIR2 family protein deacetylase